MVTCSRKNFTVMATENIISRIRYLIHEQKCTQTEFADRIDCDPSNLSKYLKGRLPVNDSLLNKIVINLGVSKAWLKDGTDVPYSKHPDHTPSVVVGENALTTVKGTPIYDIDVTAGDLPRAQMFTDEHIIGAVNIPGIPLDSRIVRVSGDSMQPVIGNGDFIVVHELPNISQIAWGQIYVVILDDYRLVKYVRKHNDAQKVILRSQNPNYDDIIVRRHDIKEMMIVQNILHISSCI
jgi:phage repressor protein C with HTH and peptisase S24 domain